MNIIFHATAALGIIATLNNTEKPAKSSKSIVSQALAAFAIGLISHGALDYIPHCYPIDPKIDVIVGSFIIGMLTLLSKSNYRIIVALTFLGSIFPDLVDLSPQILNKFLGTSIPVSDNVFPWHWEKYSGSIFIDDCKTSTLNHSILVFVVVIICVSRRNDLLSIFVKKSSS